MAENEAKKEAYSWTGLHIRSRIRDNISSLVDLRKQILPLYKKPEETQPVPSSKEAYCEKKKGLPLVTSPTAPVFVSQESYDAHEHFLKTTEQMERVLAYYYLDENNPSQLTLR